MPRWTALLFFPFAPALAARWLQRSLVACTLPAVVGILIGTGFLVAGTSAGDAWATAGTYVRFTYAVAVGGTLCGLAALRLVGRDAGWKDLMGPGCAAAAWAPFAFVAFLVMAQALGAGAASGLYSGLLLLIWGAATGMAILSGEERSEPGRLLVGTCLALSGCLVGFWTAHRIPPPVPVQAVRSPFEADRIYPGQILLVRTGASVEGPALVLLRETGTNEAAFARLDRNGNRTLVGDISVTPKMLQDWNIAGRVFFRFGSPGAGSVVGTEQTPQVSQD